MAFDPDAFLDKLDQAQGTKTEPVKQAGFDPDAFLSKVDSAPGGESNPVPTDIYGSDKLRAAASFGNVSGIGKHLVSRGYTDAKRNANGDLIVKGNDGTWYKDADNFTAHPINWTESHLGKALPLIGMAGGGAAGAVGGLPGAVGGAAVGSAAGEGLRQAAGSYMGMNDASPVEMAKDAGTEALVGGASEAVGRPLSEAVAPYVSEAASSLGNGVKNAVSWLSEKSSGADRDAVRRLIERPDQVLGASQPGRALEVAKNAQNEFANTDAAQLGDISNARQAFRSKYGESPVDTSSIIENQNQFLSRSAPNSQGRGPLSPEELEDVKNLLQKDLVDPKTGQPNVSAGDLQKLADYLKTQETRFKGSKSINAPYTPAENNVSGLYGQIKGKLHELSPELADADARFSGYKQDASLLGRLDNPASMESFVNNLYGANKGVQQEAASRVIPESLEDVKDLAANRSFGAQGPAGSQHGYRRMVGAALGLHGAETAMHSPLLGAAEMAAGLGVNPEVQRAVIGKSSQAIQAIKSAPWFQAIQKNPQLIESIANPELRKIVSGFLNETGAALPAAAEYEDGKPKDRAPARQPSGFDSHEEPTQEYIHPDVAKNQFLQGN